MRSANATSVLCQPLKFISLLAVLVLPFTILIALVNIFLDPVHWESWFIKMFLLGLSKLFCPDFNGSKFSLFFSSRFGKTEKVQFPVEQIWRIFFWKKRNFGRGKKIQIQRMTGNKTILMWTLSDITFAKKHPSEKRICFKAGLLSRWRSKLKT